MIKLRTLIKAGHAERTGGRRGVCRVLVGNLGWDRGQILE